MRLSQERRSMLKFQEFFQDEDINLDDYIYENVPNTNAPVQIDQNKYNLSDELPIQLVKNNSDREFVVNMAAIDLLNLYDKPVALVCLAGKYRTGKSFLLNKLMKLKGKGFKVSSATSACTQGIWMWSKPIYNQKQDCLMFIIDTEGSEATNRNADHDAKIFTIAILISSYFIYNSVGAIDQLSINQLNLVATLCKNIVSKGNITEQSLHRYMPKFLWLLRDFVLQVQNQSGKQASPVEYLQYCLDQRKGNQQTKNTKIALKTVFRERDCMMMITPTEDENNIRKLSDLPQSQLRPEFIEGVNILRSKIINNTSPKIVSGQPLNTKMLGDIIISYVDSINKGAVPNIISAWDQIGEDAALEAYDAGIQAYNQKFDHYFQTDKAKQDSELNRILKEMRDAALDAYDYNLETANQKMRKKLKNFLDEKEQTIILINQEFNESHNIKILAEYSQTLVDNVEAGKYSFQNPQLLNQDLKTVISRYNIDAQGNKKCEILTLFLTNFNAMILKSYNDRTKQKYNSFNMNNEQDKRLNQDYEQRIKILQNRLDSATKQMETKEARSGRELQDERKKVEEARNQVIALRQQIEAMNDKKKKKKCFFF